MSSRDYFHEKAEESRHNETVAYIMFLTGALFFVGGILENLSLQGEPAWFLIIPYSTQLYAGAVLGLSLLAIGICLIIFGIIAGLNYSRDRSWYMQELRKANVQEKATMDRKLEIASRKKKETKSP